jgi:ribonuclease HII
MLLHEHIYEASRPAADSFRLACRKYDDSKVLTEAKHSSLCSQVKADKDMAWAVDSLSAAYISSNMLRRGRVSLNELANQSTFRLIRLFQEQGMNIHKVRSYTAHK